MNETLVDKVEELVNELALRSYVTSKKIKINFIKINFIKNKPRFIVQDFLTDKVDEATNKDWWESYKNLSGYVGKHLVNIDVLKVTESILKELEGSK
jgi:hypothetical protein